MSTKEQSKQPSKKQTKKQIAAAQKATARNQVLLEPHAVESPQQMSKLVNTIFEEYGMLDGVIDSYDQLINNMPAIIQGFQFKHTYTNMFKQKLTIKYELSNTSVETEDQVLLEATLQQSRGIDFLASFVSKITFVIEMVAPDGAVRQIRIPSSDFVIKLSVLTGCCVDPATKLSPRQRWDRGIDINYIGGDVLLSSVCYILPNIPSFPFNKPIVVTADKPPQVVRCEYLRQIEELHGNQYYTSFHILERKAVKLPDIVAILKQPQDPRFIKSTNKDPIYVPISLLFYAFYVKNDAELLKCCNPDDDDRMNYFLHQVFKFGQYHNAVYNKDGARRSRKMSAREARDEIAKIILTEESHGDIDMVLEKCLHDPGRTFLVQLGEIVREMYETYIDPTHQADKDDLKNKRTKTVAWQVLSELRSKMWEIFKSTMISVEKQIIQYTFEEIEANTELVRLQLHSAADDFSSRVENSMKRAFTSSNSAQQSQLKKTQNDEKTRQLDITQKREIVTRPEGMGKVVWDRRKNHKSHWAFIDAIQTPESGANVGRFQSPTTYAYTTPAISHQRVKQFILQHELCVGDPDARSGLVSIQINYTTVGFVAPSSFKQLYKDLLEWRRINAFVPTGEAGQARLTKSADQLFISVYYSVEKQTIGVLTDANRQMIPIMRGEWNGTDSFRTMLQTGQAMWICPTMIDNFVLKEYQYHQYAKFVEYDGGKRVVGGWYLLPYGLSAIFPSINPFAGHMKPTRASLSTSHMKQGICQPYSNHMARCSGQQLVSQYVQHSPIDTSMSRSLWRATPITQLVFASFMQFTYNQEDAIITSQGCLARGCLSTSSYRTVSQTCSRQAETFRTFEPTINDPQNRLVNNEHFMVNEIGLHINYKDTLVWKVVTVEDTKTDQYKLIYDVDYERKFTCTSNVIYESLINNVIKLVRTWLSRQPIIGDKFASRSAQKGTIGAILPEWQSPITKLGIVPGLILNAQSIPKRETWGQPLELVMNRQLIDDRTYVMQTGMDEQATALISRLGDRENDVMYGPTAEQSLGYRFMERIMCGPISYAAQCHLSAQKIRARDHGQNDRLGRQPVQGKQNNGALKNGTLEQVALLTHGVSNLIKDHYGKNSSDTIQYNCSVCHRFDVYYDSLQLMWKCPTCGNLKANQVLDAGRNHSLTLLSQILNSSTAVLKGW